jgi:SAM-dependent MidA family methyltransferase
VSLLERLIAQIRSAGPIPFEEFQSVALYDPDDGFFGSGKLRSAKEGDFLTSPEVSPLFGETVAVWVNGILDDLGRRGIGSRHRESSGPSSPVLVEIGAGSGSLLRPLLGPLEHPFDAWAVEASPAARVALADLLPANRVVQSLDETPTTFSGVVIANELVDNLPVALAVRTRGGWEERLVGEEEGRLVLVRHEARPEVAAWAERFGLPCPDGGRVEVQLAASSWLRDVLGRLESGAVLIIDYGETAEGLKHRRLEGTLRTYRAHHLGPQPLLGPGGTDITVDVNFSALVAVCEELAATVEVSRQDDFLESLGLRDRIAGLRERELTAARSGDTMAQLQARSERTNAETLLHPRGLGDFRVLVART